MAKSSKKGSRIKVPKRVAGIKIPKTVRKGPVLEFVNSSAGRLLMAEALTAAVAIFAYTKRDSPVAERIKGGVHDAEEMLASNTARLSFAFGEGVRAFRDALAQPAPEAAVEEKVEEVDAIEAARQPVKKKARYSSSEPVTPSL